MSIMKVLCSGSYLVDFIVPGLPRIGEPGSLTYAPEGIHISPGGHSANVSLCLVKLNQKEVHSTGCTGKDLWHNYIYEELTRQGIRVHSCQVDGNTSKNISLTVKGEDRRFIAELSSNSRLPFDLVKKLIDVEPVVFYQGTVGGLTYIDPSLKELLKYAHSRGAFTFIDVIPPLNGWGHIHDSYEQIDFLHCNLQEGRSMSCLSEPKEIAEFLVGKGIGVAVISMGREGAILSCSKFTITMPAFNVQEIDSTGAGDAFSAGMIDGLLRGSTFTNMDIQRCLRVLLNAQAAGAACITGYGASASVTRDNVDQLIMKQGESIIDRTVID